MSTADLILTITILLPATCLGISLWYLGAFNLDPEVYVAKIADRQCPTVLVVKCKHWHQRRLGLFNHVSLDAGHGVWLQPAKSVDNRLLNFAVDIVFSCPKNRIVKVVQRSNAIESGVRPYGSALILGAGTLDLLQDLQLGDRLEFTRLEEDAHSPPPLANH